MEIEKQLQDSYLIPDDFLQKYSVIGDVGSGGQAKVYKVQNQQTKINYAAKAIELESAQKTDLDTLSILKDTKNIIKLEQFFVSNSQLAQANPTKQTIVILILELCDTDLHKYIKKTKITGKMLQSILQSIISALIHMKKSQHFHRDIQPQNILINLNPDQSIKQIKLTDFGISRKVKEGGLYDSYTAIGTVPFMSPLVREGYQNDQQEALHNLEQSDVFSLGITLLQTILNLNLGQIGKLNIKGGEEQIKKLILSIDIVEIREILQNMLWHDEDQRWDYEQVMEATKKLKFEGETDVECTKVNPIPIILQELQVDILFIMDITDSMNAWSEKCVDSIKSTIQYVRTHYNNSEFRLGFLGYRDRQDSKQFEILEFTNIDEFQKFVEKIKCQGGHDFCQDVAAAFQQSLSFDWKSQIRYAILITDAPCHGRQYHDLLDQNDHYVKEIIKQEQSLEYNVQKLAELEVDLCVIKLSPHIIQMVNIMNEAYQEIRKNEEIWEQELGSTNCYSFFLSVTVVNTIEKKNIKEMAQNRIKKLKELEEKQQQSLLQKEYIKINSPQIQNIKKSEEEQQTQGSDDEQQIQISFHEYIDNPTNKDDIQNYFKSKSTKNVEVDQDITTRDLLQGCSTYTKLLKDIKFVKPIIGPVTDLQDFELQKNFVDIYGNLQNNQNKIVILFQKL